MSTCFDRSVCPRRSRSASTRVLLSVLSFTLFTTAGAELVLTNQAAAGFTDQRFKVKQKGLPLPRYSAAYRSVQDAINDIGEQSNNLSEPLKSLFKEVSAGLTRLLLSGGIDMENDPSSNRKNWATTKMDKSRRIAKDKINVNPVLLGLGNEAKHVILKAVLFHEALHAMGFPESQHWYIYPFEMFVARLKGMPFSYWFFQDTLNKWLAELNPFTGGSGGGSHDPLGKYVAINMIDNRVHEIDPDTFDERGSFASGFARPVDVMTLETSQGEVLLVSGTDATETSGGIMCFRDLDADGWVDSTSASYVVAPGGLAAPISMTQDSTTGDLLVLDSITNAIYRLRDTDSDEIPDFLESAPWADATQFPGLGAALTVTWLNAGHVAIGTEPAFLTDVLSPNDTTEILVDDDLDGDADRVELATLCEGLADFTPTLWPNPLSGDAAVQVNAQAGAEVVVRAVTDSMPGAVLGTGTVPDCEQAATISLVRALVAGETLWVSTPASAESVTLVPVLSPRPEILDVFPPMAAEGQTITLRGRLFQPGSICRIGGVSATVVSLAPDSVRVVVPIENLDAIAHVAVVELISPAHDTATVAVGYDLPLATSAPVPPPNTTLRLGLQVFPNPAPHTTISIRWALPRPGCIELQVLSITGQRVRRLISGFSTAGPRGVEWDGRDDRGLRVAPGIYIVGLTVGGQHEIRRMALLR